MDLIMIRVIALIIAAALAGGPAFVGGAASASGASRSDWPVAADVEQGGVRISAELRASVYRWTVTNLGSSPIVSFEVDHYKGYNLIAPDGWSQIDDPKLTYFRAWTDDPRRAIRPGESAAVAPRMIDRPPIRRPRGTMRAEVGPGLAAVVSGSEARPGSR